MLETAGFRYLTVFERGKPEDSLNCRVGIRKEPGHGRLNG